MSHLSLAEWLAELEDDPGGVDMLDIDALLRRVGYIYVEYPGTHLYRHKEWGSTYTFTEGFRTVPAGYVVRIAREVKANLVREGSL